MWTGVIVMIPSSARGQIGTDGWAIHDWRTREPADGWGVGVDQVIGADAGDAGLRHIDDAPALSTVLERDVETGLVSRRDEHRAVVSVCPATVVEAAVEQVWGLLTQPEGFDLWVDADLESAQPDGPAHAGQRMRFHAATGLGFRLPVTVDVCSVDPAEHRLRMLARLPFGIENDQTTMLSEAGPARTLVRFG